MSIGGTGRLRLPANGSSSVDTYSQTRTCTTGWTASPGTAWVFGSWTQISADVGSKGIYIVSLALGDPSGINAILELGVGATSSEVTLYKFTSGYAANNEFGGYISLHDSPIYVPPSSRLAMRVKDADTSIANTYELVINYVTP